MADDQAENADHRGAVGRTAGTIFDDDRDAVERDPRASRSTRPARPLLTPRAGENLNRSQDTTSPLAVVPFIISTNSGVPTAVIMTLSQRPTGRVPSDTCGPYGLGACGPTGRNPGHGWRMDRHIRRQWHERKQRHDAFHDNLQR